MAMENQDFTIWSGDYKTIQVTVTGPSNSIVDLTGTTITWYVLSGSSKIITKTMADDVAIVDARNGIFRIVIRQADTESKNGTFLHEAELTDQFGDTMTIMTGKMTIKQSAK